MLRAGGSAIDAAIAADAMMGVVEPMATGVGGDVMAVVARGDHVTTYNGSGRAPASARPVPTVESDHGFVPNLGGRAVTVPGAVAGWWDLHDRFGVLGWERVLGPAVDAAEGGFSVTPKTAGLWAAMGGRLDEAGRALYLRSGRPPAAGETWRNPELGATLSQLVRHGPERLYRGPIAAAACEAVARSGGGLSEDDLAGHHGDWVTPLRAAVADLELVTLPPNCQGVVALVALGLLDEEQLLGAAASAELVVAQAQGLDRAFDVAVDVVCDPQVTPMPPLAELRAEARRRPTGGRIPYAPGTVFTAVARGGEFVALISSICDRFGAGVTVTGHGFVLQSRGRGFNADAAHHNGLAGGRRPYHTIVPTVGLRAGRPVLSLGVVGGVMQPQGQIQVLGRLLRGELPQAAVDAPRFRLLGERQVAVEDGLPDRAAAALEAAGYRPRPAGSTDFGGAYTVFLDARGVLLAGTDRRKDGAAARLNLPG